MLGSSDVGGPSSSGSHREPLVCTVGVDGGIQQRYEPVRPQFSSNKHKIDASDEDSRCIITNSYNETTNKIKKQKLKLKKNDHLLTKFKALTLEKWFSVCLPIIFFYLI